MQIVAYPALFHLASNLSSQLLLPATEAQICLRPYPGSESRWQQMNESK